MVTNTLIMPTLPFFDHMHLEDGSVAQTHEIMGWSVDNFKKTPHGVCDPKARNGDFGLNSAKYIVETKDKSEWAYQVFKTNAIALEQGLRWPMQAEIMGYVIDDRSPFDITRDCYIYLITCAVFLGLPHYIKRLKIPRRLFNPCVFAWRKYLITGNRIYYAIYRTGIWFNGLLPQKEYVRQLNRFMEMAVDLKREQCGG